MIHCNLCNRKSYAFDNFLDMQLSFEEKLNSTRIDFQEISEDEPVEAANKVETMIEHFLCEEYLEFDYRCTKCQQQGGCTKRLIIQKFPKVLVL